MDMIFKELFEAITGFEIEEEETVFSLGKKKQDFVLGFYVHKPNETIHYNKMGGYMKYRYMIYIHS